MTQTDTTNTRAHSYLIAAALSTFALSNCSLEQTLEEVPFEHNRVALAEANSLFGNGEESTGVTKDLNDIGGENIALSFIQTLLDNSTELESDYVEYVDENFWDLV